MEPAHSIVVMLGGPQIVAQWLSLTPGAVSRWYAPLKHGGCGGLVPSRHVPALCRLAKVQGKFLVPNMFFEGHL